MAAAPPHARTLFLTGILTASAWVVAGLAMSGRGLDITDEGFYLLSYRWWDVNPYTFTGVQYLFGPIYEALGYDVQLLRVLRILLILTVHVVLGLVAAAWIRDTAGLDSNATRDSAVMVTVTASGGIILAWGPLSPGYNDVSLLGSVLLAAGVLWTHRCVVKDGRLPVSVALLTGPVLLALTLAKWSSALLVIPFVLTVAVMSLARQTRRGVWTWLASVILSTVGSIIVLHVTVGPLEDVLGPMAQVTERLGAGSNSPANLLAMYLSSTSTLLLVATLPVALVMTLVLLRLRFSASPTSLAPMAPPLAGFVAVALLGGVDGGANGVVGYATVLISITGTVWLASLLVGDPVLDREPGVRPLFVMLLCLPAVQAVGTGNPLYFLAVNGFSLWVVLMLRVWAVRRRGDAGGKAASLGVVASLLVIAWVACNGVLADPYRTATWAENSAPVTSDSTGRLLLAEDVAQSYRALQQAVGADGPSVMAFDEMAGLVLLLDGRSVGESWYSAADPARTTHGITTTCRASPKPWEDGSPVLLFNRDITQVEVKALQECGLSFYSDFRGVPVPNGPEGLTLYLPEEAVR